MDIRFDQLPFAGEAFRFHVVGGRGSTRTEVLLGSQSLKTFDCDDPPCHEMVLIPSNARGTSLRIKTRDAEGNTAEIELEVADSNSGSSSMASAAG